MSRILCVDDEPTILAVFSSLLKAQGHDVSTAGDGHTALNILENSPEFNVLISDMRMSPMNGMELLQKAHAMKPKLAIIMLTAYSSVETAIESLKFGAFDYCTKPFKVDEFLSVLNRALAYNKTLTESDESPEEPISPEINYFMGHIVAESDPMREVCQNIKKVAPTETTVLISGEAGTGKQLIARTIHAFSSRASSEFIDINCAEIPEELLESALFGHLQGSVAADPSERIGCFEGNQEGTVLLEEIDSMPASIQDKLMNFLQTKTFTKKGSKKEIESKVRIVCSSHNDPLTVMSAGAFRADLFSRIGTLTIEIKPLRERKQDILPIAWLMIKECMTDDQSTPSVDPEVFVILEAYKWPGNTNELQSVIAYAVERAAGGRITKACLPEQLAALKVNISTGAIQDPEKSKGISLRAFLSAKAGLPRNKRSR